MDDTIKLGVSSCLLGNKVRYDGGHKQDRFLTGKLGLFAEYVPLCPEVECVMEIPRESIRLVGDSEDPRLETTRTGIDKTRMMKDWIGPKLDELEKEDLCGFIFKSKSPSSGLYRIRVYGDDGKVRKTGRGLFAAAFVKRFPRIPVEEAERLNDAGLREHFVINVFALKRWRRLLETNRTLGGLVEFHTDNKLLILSHSPKHYRQMGKLVAEGKKYGTDELFDMYERILLAAFSLKTTVKKNINVLEHMQGYFKKDLNKHEKSELVSIIDRYRSGYVPLIVPLTLLNHYVMKYDQPYLSRQTYLNPHPYELKLRTYF